MTLSNPSFKYNVEKAQKEFLIDFLNSYVETFKKRHGYVDFTNLYHYNAPLYFESCLKFCSELYDNDDSVIDKLSDFYRDNFLKNNTDNEILKKNLNQYLSTDITLSLGKKSHQTTSEDKMELVFLKFNNTLFILEKSKYKINDIQIILPAEKDKQQLFLYQKDFYLLLESLYKDFRFL